MPAGRLIPADLPPRWSWVSVCLLHALAAITWGDPELLHDEADYIAQGRLLAAWLGGEPGVAGGEVIGRLALHNPGYAALVAVLEALSGQGAVLVRGLQCLAGVATGFILYGALLPRLGRKIALGVTFVLWLHPSMIFFRLSLWPVALATLGTTLLAACALRMMDDPETTLHSGDPSPVRRCFAWTLALLPFLAPSALLLIPLAALAFGVRRAKALCGPSLALWLPWMLALSLTLGAFAPVDLSASRNLVLANHRAISEGRGSLWGDPAAKQTYLAELALACPSTDILARKRCAHRFNMKTTRQTVSAEPSAAVQRSLLRIAETWAPDQFLPRSLRIQGRPGAGLVTGLLGALHWALLALALLGLRSRAGRAALLATALWTLPIVIGVGFTRLRQPVLPLLLIAAAFGIHSLTHRGKPRSSP